MIEILNRNLLIFHSHFLGLVIQLNEYGPTVKKHWVLIQALHKQGIALLASGSRTQEIEAGRSEI